MARPLASSASPFLWATQWRPTSITVRRLALASLIANIVIVSTGGLVRLTSSGLGCPSWPDCSPGSLVPTNQLSWHKGIEFGNRMLTYVVVAAVVAVFIAVSRAQPRREEVRRWAWVTLLGVPAQIVLGGILIYTKLNPFAVAAHFMLSMSLIAAATVLWWLTREIPATPLPPQPMTPALLRRLGLATWALTFVVFVVGTLVTGSGPHAGDPKAVRLHLQSRAISQLHADLVMLLVGLAVALAVCLTAIGAPPVARRAGQLLVAVLAGQAAIGFAQYFSGLPIPLVELHVTGAALLAAASTAVVLALSEPGVPVTHM
jgi:cytochrome c oxidase assembly protein subunit 15